MKKFLERLSKVKSLYDDVAVSEAEAKFKSMKSKYSQLIDHRALYNCKGTKESRVVYLVEAYDKYVVVRYKYETLDYSGTITTSVSYSSLLCGDQRLEVE